MTQKLTSLGHRTALHNTAQSAIKWPRNKNVKQFQRENRRYNLCSKQLTCVTFYCL